MMDKTILSAVADVLKDERKTILERVDAVKALLDDSLAAHDTRLRAEISALADQVKSRGDAFESNFARLKEQISATDKALTDLPEPLPPVDLEPIKGEVEQVAKYVNDSVEALEEQQVELGEGLLQLERALQALPEPPAPVDLEPINRRLEDSAEHDLALAEQIEKAEISIAAVRDRLESYADELKAKFDDLDLPDADLKEWVAESLEASSVELLKAMDDRRDAAAQLLKDSSSKINSRLDSAADDIRSSLSKHVSDTEDSLKSLAADLNKSLEDQIQSVSTDIKLQKEFYTSELDDTFKAVHEEIDVLKQFFPVMKDEIAEELRAGITNGKDGERGATGERGARGEDGKDADPQEVVQILYSNEDFLKQITGERGEKGDRGEDGADGVDRIYVAPRKIEKGAMLERNDVIIFDGGLWQAVQKTSSVPSEQPAAFLPLVQGIKNIVHEFDAEDRFNYFIVEMSDGETHTLSTFDAPRLRYEGDGLTATKGDVRIEAECLEQYTGQEWAVLLKLRGLRGRKGLKGEKGDPGKSPSKAQLKALVEEQLADTLLSEEFKSWLLDVLIPEQEDIDQEIKRYAGGWRDNKSYRKGDVVSSPSGLYLALRDTKEELHNNEAWVRMQGSVGGMSGGGGGGGLSLPANVTYIQRYIFDPITSKTHWIDARGDLAIVNQVSELSNRLILPQSELAKGKLVVVKSTGQLFELNTDPATMLNTIGDWKELGAGGVKYVNRLQDLPNARSMPVPQNGDLYVVKVDFEGKPYYRLASWDASIRGAPAKATVTPGTFTAGDVIADNADYTALITAGPVNEGRWYVIDNPQGVTPIAGEPYAGVNLPVGTKLIDLGNVQRGIRGWIVASPDANYRPGQVPQFPNPQRVDDLSLARDNGGWRFLNRESYVNALASDPDHPLDNKKGDFQTVIERDKKIIKVFDGTGWVTLFDEVQIKGWIASLALFRGTASEDPTQHPGTVTWTDLPDLPALSAAQDKTHTGRYWIWAGNDPFPVVAGTAGTAPSHAQARQGVAIDLAHGITDDASLVQALNTDPKPNQWAGRTVTGGGFTPAAGNPFAGTALAAGDGLFWTGAAGFSINDTTNNVVYENGWALVHGYTAGDRLVMDAATRTALNNAIDGLPAVPAVGATPRIGADLDGATLHVGDWLVIADQGTGIAGDPNEVDLHWVRVGGDLLTKSRGTNLFGLKNWTDGSYEKDSLTVRAGDIYRARTAVVPGDPAPDAAPSATVPATAGQQPITQIAGVTFLINNQADFERLLLNTPAPSQWAGYQINATFTLNGTTGGFFDTEDLTTGEWMVWTGFPTLNIDDTANNIKIVNGWWHDTTMAQTPAGAPIVVVSAAVLTAMQAAATAYKWTRVPIGGGLKFLPDETGLPAAGNIGDNYLILVSPTYGNGAPAIVTWDQGAGQFVVVSGGGGGGAAMNFMRADPLIGVGCPIGTIIMWASATIPPGWLPLTGQAIDATAYPELAALFPGGHLPDMAGQFVRIGAIEAGFTKHPHTTARPRHAFVTSTDGQHHHSHGFNQIHNNWDSGGGGGPYLGYVANTGNAGEHHHTITGGGDPETAPDHVYLGMLIKAAEKTAHIRPAP